MSRVWFPLAAAGLLAACNPYERFVDESSAGAVDPINFPADYLGTGGSAKMTGQGTMDAAPAAVGNASTGYYFFPYAGDPNLSLAVEGKLIIPIAYDFDDDPAAKCVAPDGYVYDQQRDDVRYDQQGNVFIQLPDASGYQPVVAGVTVRPMGLPCQDTKSEKNLVERQDLAVSLIPPEHPDQQGAHPTGKPSGKYYARPIIDPSIDVRNPDGSVDPNTGLGPQKWGWYQRYLLAYLDGGEIPTLDKQVMNASGKLHNVTTMVTQAIYFPSQHPGVDPQGNTVPLDGALGDGYDVLTAKRGQMGFSPLCEVFSFDPVDPMNPETDVAKIDMATAVPTGNLIWCIQVGE